MKAVLSLFQLQSFARARKLIIQRAHRGFTLLELLIVVGILAVLATLIVARFGSAGKDAKLKTAIANLHEATRVMDLFTQVSQGPVPDGFDSLLSSDASAIYSGNPDNDENSGVWSGWLTVDGLSAGEYQSLLRVASNPNGPPPFNVMMTVYDHSATASEANRSTEGAAARTLDNGGSSNVAFVNPATSTGAAIYNWLNLDIPEEPTGDDDDDDDDTTTPSFRVVAFGIGSNCTMVGGNQYDISVAEPPIAADPSPNSQYAYSRVIALFRVSSDGGYFAEYLGAVNSFGKNSESIRRFLD